VWSDGVRVCRERGSEEADVIRSDEDLIGLEHGSSSTRAQGGGETHECERCGEVFQTEQELERHIAERHANEDRTVPEGTGGSRSEGGAGMIQTE
jgi:uncharacterized C2H2 Zn-finger protein